MENNKIGIFGEIGLNITPDQVKAELDKQKDVTVLIDSMGGEVFAGLTIFNLLKSHPFNVDIEILGMAGSIASVIALAGDSVKMAETASFFIHNALIPNTGGNAEDLRDQADTLETISTTIRNVYQGKTNLKAESLQGLMDKESILTADQALEFGFIDEIINPVAMAAKFNHIDMNKLNELKTIAAAVGKRLGIKNETEIPTEVEEAIEKEIGEAVEEGVKTAAETETELEALSEMIPRAEFEEYKAEILALIKPVLDAMDLVPSKEEMENHVNQTTSTKIGNVLTAMKSKTTIPSASNDFAPVEVENTGRLRHGFLAAKREELNKKNGR